LGTSSALHLVPIDTQGTALSLRIAIERAAVAVLSGRAQGLPLSDPTNGQSSLRRFPKPREKRVQKRVQNGLSETPIKQRQGFMARLPV